MAKFLKTTNDKGHEEYINADRVERAYFENGVLWVGLIPVKDGTKREHTFRGDEARVARLVLEQLSLPDE